MQKESWVKAKLSEEQKAAVVANLNIAREWYVVAHISFAIPASSLSLPSDKIIYYKQPC